MEARVAALPRIITEFLSMICGILTIIHDHSWVALFVECCCTLNVSVGCILSPDVYFILFVYHCEVCGHIQLRAWILRYCILVGRMMLFYHVLLLPLSIAWHSEWNGVLWTDTNGWYRMTCVSVKQGCPTFLWQRSTPVTVDWFMGRTWKITSGVPHQLNYCGLRPRAGDPCRKRNCILNRSNGTLQLSRALLIVNVVSVAVITCAVRMCRGVACESRKYPP
jgi:hypothetical protein